MYQKYGTTTTNNEIRKRRRKKSNKEWVYSNETRK